VRRAGDKAVLANNAEAVDSSCLAGIGLWLMQGTVPSRGDAPAALLMASFFLVFGLFALLRPDNSERQWIVLPMGGSKAVGIRTSCQSKCCDTAWEASGSLAQPSSLTLLTLL
jgi:hypothetical protein